MFILDNSGEDIFF